MAAGIGFVRDALNSAKQNRNNLKNKRNFKKTYTLKNLNKDLRFKEGTPEEIAQFRKEFHRRKLIRTIKRAVLMAIIFGAIAYMMWQVLF